MVAGRGMQSYKVYTWGTLDTYGQPGLSNTYEMKDLYIRPYSQVNVNNPEYVKITLAGLTKENITTANVIEVSGVKYRVKYIIPSDRYVEVLMEAL